MSKTYNPHQLHKSLMNFKCQITQIFLLCLITSYCFSPLAIHAQTEDRSKISEPLSFQVIKVPYELIHQVFSPGTELDSITFKEWNQLLHESDIIKYRQNFTNQSIEKLVHTLKFTAGQLYIQTSIHYRPPNPVFEPIISLSECAVLTPGESMIQKFSDISQIGVSNRGQVSIIPDTGVSGFKKLINSSPGSTENALHYDLELKSTYVSNTILETNSKVVPFSSNGIWNLDGSGNTSKTVIWTFSGNQPPVDLWLNITGDPTYVPPQNIFYQTQSDWNLTNDSLSGIIRINVWGPPDRFEVGFAMPDDCFMINCLVDGKEYRFDNLEKQRTVRFDNSLTSQHQIVLTVRKNRPDSGRNEIPSIALKNSRLIGNEIAFNNLSSGIVSGFNTELAESLIPLPTNKREDQRTYQRFRFFTKVSGAIMYYYKSFPNELLWTGSIDYVINNTSNECYIKLRIPEHKSLESLRLVIISDLKFCDAIIRSVKKDSADNISGADVVIEGRKLELRIPSDKISYDRRFLEIKLNLQTNGQPTRISTPEIVLGGADRLRLKSRLLTNLLSIQAEYVDKAPKNWQRNDRTADSEFDNRILADTGYKILATWEDYPKSLRTNWNLIQNDSNIKPSLIWLAMIYDCLNNTIHAVQVQQDFLAKPSTELQKNNKTEYSGLKNSGLKAGSESGRSDLKINDMSTSYRFSRKLTKFTSKTIGEEFQRFIESIPNDIPILFVSNKSETKEFLMESGHDEIDGFSKKLGLATLQDLSEKLEIPSDYRLEYAGFISRSKIDNASVLERILHLNQNSQSPLTGINRIPAGDQNVDLVIDNNNKYCYRFNCKLFLLELNQNLFLSLPDGFHIERILVNDLFVNPEKLGNRESRLNLASYRGQIELEIFYELDVDQGESLEDSGIPLVLPELNTISTETKWTVFDEKKRNWQIKQAIAEADKGPIVLHQWLDSNSFSLKSKTYSNDLIPRLIPAGFRFMFNFEQFISLMIGLSIAILLRISNFFEARLMIRALCILSFGFLAGYGLSKSWWIILLAFLSLDITLQHYQKMVHFLSDLRPFRALLLLILVLGAFNNSVIAQEPIYVVMPFTTIEESLVHPKQVIMSSDQLKRTKAFIENQGGLEPIPDGLFTDSAHLIRANSDGLIELQSEYQYQDFTKGNSFSVSEPSDDCLSVQAFWNGQKMPLRINPAKAVVEYQLSGEHKGALKIIKSYRPILNETSVRITLFPTIVSTFKIQANEIQLKGLYYESNGRSRPLKEIHSKAFSMMKQFRLQKKSDPIQVTQSSEERLTRITAVRVPDGVRWYCRIPFARSLSGDQGDRLTFQAPSSHFLLGSSQCRVSQSGNSDATVSSWSIFPDQDVDFFEIEILEPTNSSEKYSLLGLKLNGADIQHKAMIRWVVMDGLAGYWEPVEPVIANQDINDNRWGRLVPTELKSQQTAVVPEWQEALFQYRPEVPHIDHVVQARFSLQKSTISGQFIIDQSSESELLEMKPIVCDLGKFTKVVSVRAVGLLDWGMLENNPGKFYARIDTGKRNALRIEIETITTFESADPKTGTGFTLPMELPWPVIDGNIKPPGRLIVEQEVDKESAIWPTPLKHSSTVLKNLGEIRDPDTPSNMKRWLYQFEGDQTLPQVQWNVSDTYSRVLIHHELRMHFNKIKWKCVVEYDPISGPLSAIYLRSNPSAVDFKLDIENPGEYETKIQHTDNQSQFIIERKRSAFGPIRVALSHDFSMDSDLIFQLPNVVPLGRGMVEKYVSLSGFQSEFAKIDKIIESELTEIRNPRSKNNELWETRSWEFKSTNGNLSIQFKKDMNQTDYMPDFPIFLEDLLIDRNGADDYQAIMRFRNRSDRLNDLQWVESFGDLIYVSLDDKILNPQELKAKKFVNLGPQRGGSELLLIIQIEQGKLSDFLQSIRERFLTRGSDQLGMAVRNVALPVNVFDFNEISVSEWLAGSESNSVPFASPSQSEGSDDRSKIDLQSRSGDQNNYIRIEKYSKALPDNIALINRSMQMEVDPRQTKKLDSGVQDYIDGLILSDIGSWKFYQWNASVSQSQFSFGASRVRSWFSWSGMKHRLSVSILLAMGLWAYQEARKVSSKSVETDSEIESSTGRG